jgi:hypothetical protein
LLILILASAASICVPGKIERDPPFSPTECAYERLMGCYAKVMESKGLDIDSPDAALAKYDGLAQKRCASERARYRRLVGPAVLERDWKELWGDYWSRLEARAAQARAAAARRPVVFATRGGHLWFFPI